jgi:RNA polymerase sigma-70 factor, ECF subfamily
MSTTAALAPPLVIAKDRPSDAELVQRAREGDAWAEGAIYKRYSRELANLAARLLRSRTEALDVVQDVFVEVLEDLGELRDPVVLRRWLRQRVVHKVHRVFRRRGMRRWIGLSTPDAPLGLEAFASPSASPELLAQLSQISQALATLPDRQRIAWVLHRVEGETLPNVAAACGTSLATAKRDIASAQEALAGIEGRT